MFKLLNFLLSGYRYVLYTVLLRTMVFSKPLGSYSIHKLMWAIQSSRGVHYFLGKQTATVRGIRTLLYHYLHATTGTFQLDRLYTHTHLAGESFSPELWEEIGTTWGGRSGLAWRIFLHDSDGLKQLTRYSTLEEHADYLFLPDTDSGVENWVDESFWVFLAEWFEGTPTESKQLEKLRGVALEKAVKVLTGPLRDRVIKALDHWPENTLQALRLATLQKLSPSECEFLGRNSTLWYQKAWTVDYLRDDVMEQTYWVLEHFPEALIPGRAMESTLLRGKMQTYFMPWVARMPEITKALYERMRKYYPGTVNQMNMEIFRIEQKLKSNPEALESFLVLDKELSPDLTVEEVVHTCLTLTQ